VKTNPDAGIKEKKEPAYRIHSKTLSPVGPPEASTSYLSDDKGTLLLISDVATS
jgi:hypothetical protein